MASGDLDEDLFSEVLNLEDRYYREGYDLGVADGSKSGRVEGRIFGLEKGFQKFLEMGRLHGKAVVWEARLPADDLAQIGQRDGKMTLPPLVATSGNARLKKHVERLAALSDPNDLSTKNSEDTVSEFDDRVKDAKTKAMLISRMAGEDETSNTAEATIDDTASTSRGKALRVQRTGNEASSSAARRTGEMEDFAGLRR